MDLIINKVHVNFIGDPHLGLRFNHTPLHRVGDREKMQMDQFKAELEIPCNVNIMVGDLFDTFLVSNEVLMETYQAIKDAAHSNPHTHFVMMQGNHDISRQADVLSSFDVLAELLKGIKNVKVVRVSEEVDYDFSTKALGNFRVRFFPYSPFKSAVEEVSAYTGPCDLAVGHWDTMPIAGDHNLVPLKLLKDMTNYIVTGHMHTPEQFYVDVEGNRSKDKTPVEVYVTGSMQPYSHGQDPNGTMYVTHTIEQVQANLAEDPKFYHQKCLRVVIGANEEAPNLSGIDAFQLQVKRLDKIENAKVEVVSEEFSFKKIFDETFKENNVSDDTRDHYWNKYRQEANDAN